jgi:ribosomal protein S18 acetylase RimI-like enzyme
MQTIKEYLMFDKNKYRMTELSKKDCEKIARVHFDAFPNSTLTKVGKKCVIKYYEWQFTDIAKYNKLIYAYGIVEKNHLLAYTIFGKPRIALFGFIKNNKQFLFIYTLKVLLSLDRKQFKAIIKGVKIYIYNTFFKSQKNSIQKNTYEENSIGLQVIASSKEYNGLGFGKALMDKMEQIAKENKFVMIKLSVDSKNYNAIKFYEKLGYVKEIDRNGQRVKNQMIKEINN